MELQPETPPDYSKGSPRPHHRYHQPSGDITIQVENAIFKIHRFFLLDHSSVLRDMLSLPQGKNEADGTDQTPLVISGDTAGDWELLLGCFYRAHLVTAVEYKGEDLLKVLQLAHKYSMETTEEDLILSIKGDKSTEGWINLVVASQIVDSDPLYHSALEGLRRSRPLPTLEQAKRIGIEATYTLLDRRCFSCDNPTGCTTKWCSKRQ